MIAALFLAALFAGAGGFHVRLARRAFNRSRLARCLLLHVDRPFSKSGPSIRRTRICSQPSDSTNEIFCLVSKKSIDGASGSTKQTNPVASGFLILEESNHGKELS